MDDKLKEYEDSLDAFHQRFWKNEVLVCTAVSELTSDDTGSGSLQHKCSRCGEPVWVSADSWLTLHDNPRMRIECVDCALTIALQEAALGNITSSYKLDELSEGLVFWQDNLIYLPAFFESLGGI